MIVIGYAPTFDCICMPSKYFDIEKNNYSCIFVVHHIILAIIFQQQTNKKIGRENSRNIHRIGQSTSGSVMQKFQTI